MNIPAHGHSVSVDVSAWRPFGTWIFWHGDILTQGHFGTGTLWHLKILAQGCFSTWTFWHWKILALWRFLHRHFGTCAKMFYWAKTSILPKCPRAKMFQCWNVPLPKGPNAKISISRCRNVPVSKSPWPLCQKVHVLNSLSSETCVETKRPCATMSCQKVRCQNKPKSGADAPQTPSLSNTSDITFSYLLHYPSPPFGFENLRTPRF